MRYGRYERHGTARRRIGPVRPQFNCPNCGASGDSRDLGVDPGTDTGLSCPSCRTASYKGRRFTLPSDVRRNPRSGHTPGPWTIHKNIGRKSELGIVAEGAPCIIATMHGARLNEWPDIAEANAILIAAAPEMLEALKEAEATIFGPIADSISGDQMAETGAYDVLDTIRKAIAKAEGRY